MSTTRTGPSAQKKLQKLLRNFHPQTSPSKLTFFSKTNFECSLIEKDLHLHCQYCWKNPLKFFIESGIVFQGLNLPEKKEKTQNFQGLSSFNHLPISSPGSLFFRTMLRVPTVLHDQVSVIKRHRVLLDFLKELRICPAA